MRVLFIVGKGRSGSTVVGDVLGSFPSVFHMGEVWRMWSHGIIGPHLCSCGLSPEHCPVWSEVLQDLGESDVSWAVESPELVVELQRSLFGFGGMARSRITGTYARRAERYRSLAAELYRAVSRATGWELLIDSSKWPLDPVLLESPPGVESYAIHLVREPSAVATSWKTKKLLPDSGTSMPRFGPVHTAVSWTARTMAAEWVVSRMGPRGATIRFEDFLRAPGPTVREIGRTMGEDWDLEIDADRTVEVPPGHTIMGNPSRFVSGRVELAPAPLLEANPVVSGLTWPWRHRFGY